MIQKPEERHNGEIAARRESTLVPVAAILPADAVEGLVEARRGEESLRCWPPLLVGAVVEHEQLPVLLADGVRPQPDAVGDVEPPLWAAGGRDEEIVVDGDEGGVLDEDANHLILSVDGVSEECFAAVAVELEGRRPARRPAGTILEPERVVDGQVAACPGRAGRAGRRRQPENGSQEQEEERERHGLGNGWRRETGD